jgi:hypothetical protein
MRLFCRFETIFKVFADGGYTGTLIDWAKEMFVFDLEVVNRNELHTFSPNLRIAAIANVCQGTCEIQNRPLCP